MATLGIIAGTGVGEIPGLDLTDDRSVSTDLGEPSSSLTSGRLGSRDLVFLRRHGDSHDIPPHRINYRANLLALKTAGVESVIGIAAVGGITDAHPPGSVSVPHDLIDYTYGRECSFWDDRDRQMRHVEFAPPFDPELRNGLLSAAGRAGVTAVDGGVYGVTQGPRLETAAEIRRLARDGCTLVGMTLMPEAALARELGLSYATLAMVINHAAGTQPVESGGIHDDIQRHLDHATGLANSIVASFCDDSRAATA